MKTGSEMGWPRILSAISPPSGASSSEPMFTSGLIRRRYSSTSTAKTRRIPVTSAMAKLVSNSCRNFSEPAFLLLTPEGRFFISGRFSICLSAIPFSAPGARSAPM